MGRREGVGRRLPLRSRGTPAVRADPGDHGAKAASLIDPAPSHPIPRLPATLPGPAIAHRTILAHDPSNAAVFHYVGAVTRFDPETILAGYSRGIFPMGDLDGSLHWIVSDPRYVLPIGRLHVPRSLARLARKAPVEIRVNTACRAVLVHRAGGR
ncbi:MAG: hypothetical protein ACK5WD_06685, partial [bacterium]